MSDLQVFKIVDAIEGRPVSDTTSGTDRVVRVRLFGPASLVAEVTVNGYLSGDFSVVSSKVIDVTIPSVVASSPLNDLEFLILSSGHTEGYGTYEILFDIGKVSSMIRGTNVLIQKWLRFLLMSPGSDKKDPTAGAGLMALSNRATVRNLSEVRVMVARRHNECKRQIIQRQNRELSRSSREEILKDARLEGVYMGDSGRLVIRTILVDAANRSFAIGTRV